MEKLSLRQLEAKCAELGVDPNSILRTPCGGQQAFQLRMMIELLEKEKKKGESEVKRQVFYSDSWHGELAETKKKLLAAQFKILELEELCADLLKQISNNSGGGGASTSSAVPVVAAQVVPPGPFMVMEDEEEDDDGNMDIGDFKIRIVGVTGGNEDAIEENETAPDSGMRGSQQESREEEETGSMEGQNHAPGFIIPNTVPVSRSSRRRNTSPPPPPRWEFTGSGQVAKKTTNRVMHLRSQSAVRTSMETVARSLIPPPPSSIASSVAGGRKQKCKYCELKLHTLFLLDTHVKSVHRDGKKVDVRQMSPAVCMQQKPQGPL